MLRKFLLVAMAAFVLAVGVSAQERAQSQGWLPDWEWGLLPDDMTITIQDVAGKTSYWQGKRFSQGDTCLLDDDSYIYKVEDHKKDKLLVVVKFVAGTGMQTYEGYCPSFTAFTITRERWNVARQRYLDRWKFEWPSWLNWREKK